LTAALPQETQPKLPLPESLAASAPVSVLLQVVVRVFPIAAPKLCR